MSGDRLTIRSYQRIFRPDRRIYQVEGHPIPVPGGIPLSWLATFAATLLSVLLLSGRSLPLSVLLAVLAAAAGHSIGGERGALLLSLGVLAGTQLAGLVLAVIDWPLRLVVLPATVATLTAQATPDGRPALRYARSWLSLHLRPARRSLGRPLPTAGARRVVGGQAWVAGDHHVPSLRRGRVTGPATVVFRMPVVVVERRGGGAGRRRVMPAPPGTHGVVDDVELGRGEWLEVRP